MIISWGKLSKYGKEILVQQKENGCIECISHCQDNCGYTRIRVNKKPERLYRYIYEQKYGTISKGYVVRHKCDNPNCVNVNHLEIGTPKDNVRDLIERQPQKYKQAQAEGHKKIKGEDNKNSKLTEIEVENIYLSKSSYGKLAKIYNISKNNVWRIKHKETWKWFTDKIDNQLEP